MKTPVTLSCLTLALILALWTTIPASGMTITTDGFEGPTISPYWTVAQNFGTVGLTNSVVHSGNQALQFTSASGGQRTMQLTHIFAGPVLGDFSVYFYDAAPGQQTLYQQFSLRNNANPNTYISLGTQDFDALCYMVAINGAGPGANCGNFPQSTTTNVSRTLGWHQLRIVVSSTSVAGYIDGTLVHSQAGAFSFDRVDIFMSGPAGRPNTTAYFDDYTAIHSEVPEPSTAGLLGIAIAGAYVGSKRWGRTKAAAKQ